jgi:hypothetical protein
VNDVNESLYATKPRNEAGRKTVSVKPSLSGKHSDKCLDFNRIIELTKPQVVNKLSGFISSGRFFLSGSIESISTSDIPDASVYLSQLKIIHEQYWELPNVL